MNLSKVGEKILSSIHFARSLGLIPSSSDRLKGWDNAAIVGAVFYIKKEHTLEASVEVLVVAMSLIGATLVTTYSGSIADSVGRLLDLELA